MVKQSLLTEHYPAKEPDAEQLKNAERLQAQNEKLEAELATVRSSLDTLDSLLKQATLRAVNLCPDPKNQNETTARKANEQLASSVLEHARSERRVAKETFLRNSLTFGHIKTEISVSAAGTRINERLVGGDAYQEMEARKAELEDERHQLEQAKKAKRRGKSDNPDDLLMSKIQEQVLVLRFSELERRTKEYEMDEARLFNKKMVHIREAKRIQDEDSSKWNKFPTLNDRYVFVKLLGKGGFAEVWKAWDTVGLEFVACKLHRVEGTWSEEKQAKYVEHATREYRLHKRLAHPGVVALKDVFEIDCESFCTVLELCEGGDLDEYLRENNHFKETDARAVFVQVLAALVYLHAAKVIHYDLKPANVLFNRGAVKITDFGLSKELVTDESHMALTSHGAGTYWYLPPECLPGSGSYDINIRISPKVDVWSVGVLFYQLLYGKKPFGEGMSQDQMARSEKNWIVQFPETKPAISEETKHLVRRCLASDPLSRPTAQQVFEEACEQVIGRRKTTKAAPPTPPVDEASNLSLRT